MISFTFRPPCDDDTQAALVRKWATWPPVRPDYKKGCKIGGVGLRYLCAVTNRHLCAVTNRYLCAVTNRYLCAVTN